MEKTMEIETEAKFKPPVVMAFRSYLHKTKREHYARKKDNTSTEYFLILKLFKYSLFVLCRYPQNAIAK